MGPAAAFFVFVIGFSAAMAGVWKILTRPPTPEPMNVWCGETGCGVLLERAPNESTGWKHPPSDLGKVGALHPPKPVTRKPDVSQ